MLVLVGLFGILIASCLFSGGLVDWAVRQALQAQPSQGERVPTFGETPAQRLPVRKGLRDDSPVVQPARRDDSVQPDHPGDEPKQEKKGGINEDALFGVQ